MDVPAEWEPSAVFAISGRCIRLEESLTVFDDGLSAERSASFASDESFDQVSARLDRVVGTKSAPGFADETLRRSHEWAAAGGARVTLDEEVRGTLSVSVSRGDGVGAGKILAAIAHSPLAAIDERLRACGALSGVGSVRAVDEPPRWHLQGTIDDDERDELVDRLVELGFDDQGLENHFRRGDQRFVVGDYHWTAFVPAPSI
jgi:hypothetical protein